MAEFSFPKGERIVGREDFARLRNATNKVHTRHFIVVWNVTGGLGRIGITVSRKVGNAVVRNRIKRLLREFYRHHKPFFSGGDYNIIAKRGSDHLDYSDVCHELDVVLTKK